MSAPPDSPDVRDDKSKTALDASADPAATTGASVTKSSESAAGSSAPGTSAPAPVELDAYGKQKKVHDLTYPPWPAVPAGATITPFAAFKERGIKRHCGGIEADEVDANGVPTVALSSAHEDDECKTDSRFRNFTSAKPKAPKRMEVKANWWETWEEVEGTMRPTRNYNHMLPDDMVIQLVQEFIETHKRWWPSPGSGPTDPRALFDDFQRFIGTMDQSTAPPNAAADSDDDEDDAPMEIVDGEGAPFVPPSTMDVVNDDSFGPANPKLEAFLADPALVVRRFLSSHARERGHIYHERNLLGLPKIIEFFLSFVTRSGVIKDAKLKKGFTDALAVAKKAVIEIPKTSQVARAMPDTVFSKGCQSLWGRKTNAFHFADDLWTPSASGPVPEARITEIVEPSEALPVLNGRVDPNAVIREEVEAGRLSFVNPEDEQVPPTADAFDGGSWGGTNGGWGGPGGDTTGGWGEGEGEGAGGWGGAGAWDDEDVPMADIPLAPPAHEALLALPGLAPLRTTHTWGIVEHSMRRVKGVFAPSPPQAGQPDVEPARAVENALGGTFARVVLEPWPDFHEGADLELNRPSILEASRGAVVEEGGDGKGHDPLKKEISVLVDVDMKDKIEVGMGVAGTWVQVVRDVKEGAELQETGGKKKKTKKADYWYMDDLVMTIPSFYTG